MTTRSLTLDLNSAAATCEDIIASDNWHGSKEPFKKILTKLEEALKILREYEGKEED